MIAAKEGSWERTDAGGKKTEVDYGVVNQVHEGTYGVHCTLMHESAGGDRCGH